MISVDAKKLEVVGDFKNPGRPLTCAVVGKGSMRPVSGVAPGSALHEIGNRLFLDAVDLHDVLVPDRGGGAALTEKAFADVGGGGQAHDVTDGSAADGQPQPCRSALTSTS